MIAPPFLCGDPVEIQQVKQQTSSVQKTSSSSSTGANDDDDDYVPGPSYPVRRFRFVPTWLQQSQGALTTGKNIEDDVAAGDASKNIQTQQQDEQKSEESKERISVSIEKEETLPLYTLQIVLRSYIQLPPSDAVALFSGEDFTGLMTWLGSARMAQHIYDNFLPILRPALFSLSSSDTQEIIDDRQPHHDSPVTTTTHLQENHQLHEQQQQPQRTLMSSFVKESCDPRTVKELSSVDTLVEIGCGCGLLGLVAGYALRAKSIIFTDGNKDCTDLAEENFDMNFESVYKEDGVVRKGRSFMWKNLSDEEVSNILFSHRHGGDGDEESNGNHSSTDDINKDEQKSKSKTSSTSSSSSLEFKQESSIVIVGGDIVYDFDSVVPLVETIHSLAKGFCDVRDAMTGVGGSVSADDENVSSSRAHFFLCFYPRQWYVADNRILLENVKDKLACRGWRLLLEAGSGDNDGTLLHFVLCN